MMNFMMMTMATQTRAKRLVKLLERLFPHLKTDADGYAIFNNKRMRTKSGFLKGTGIKNGVVS